LSPKTTATSCDHKPEILFFILPSPPAMLAEKKRAGSHTPAPIKRTPVEPAEWSSESCYWLNRDTADSGPMHVLLADGFTNAQSRFSELSRDVLASVLTPYLCTRSGDAALPGVIQLTRASADPPLIDIYSWTTYPVVEAPVSALRASAAVGTCSDRFAPIVDVMADNTIRIRSQATSGMAPKWTRRRRVIGLSALRTDDLPEMWRGCDRQRLLWHNDPTALHEGLDGVRMVRVGGGTGPYKEYRLDGTTQGHCGVVGTQCMGAPRAAICTDARGSVCIAHYVRERNAYRICVFTRVVHYKESRRPPGIALDEVLGFWMELDKHASLAMCIDARGDLVVYATYEHDRHGLLLVMHEIRVFATGHGRSELRKLYPVHDVASYRAFEKLFN
jgi:hypothetical protein